MFGIYHRMRFRCALIFVLQTRGIISTPQRYFCGSKIRRVKDTSYAP